MSDEREMWALPNGAILYNVHPPSQCDGTSCWIHNPTPHHMSNWPMIRRRSGLIGRECLHGDTHYDPDSEWFFRNIEHLDLPRCTERCDGCCVLGQPEDK